MTRRCTSPLAAILVALGHTLLAAQGGDPLIGVWTLDLARSHSSRVPIPRSQTMTVTPREGGLDVVNDVVDPAGTSLSGRQALTFDGRDYPVKDSDLFDAASEERVDAFTTVRTDKKGGSVVRWITRTVSSDRNTLVVTVDVNENGGRRRTSTAVLVRQR